MNNGRSLLILKVLNFTLMCRAHHCAEYLAYMSVAASVHFRFTLIVLRRDARALANESRYELRLHLCM